jgi:hypothetical protein
MLIDLIHGLRKAKSKFLPKDLPIVCHSKRLTMRNVSSLAIAYSDV